MLMIPTVGDTMLVYDRKQATVVGVFTGEEWKDGRDDFIVFYQVRGKKIREHINSSELNYYMSEDIWTIK